MNLTLFSPLKDLEFIYFTRSIKKKNSNSKRYRESIDTEAAENGGYKKKLEELRDSSLLCLCWGKVFRAVIGTVITGPVWLSDDPDSDSLDSDLVESLFVKVNVILK